jgi:pyridoxal phosphate enzyme (YggS family)
LINFGSLRLRAGVAKIGKFPYKAASKMAIKDKLAELKASLPAGVRLVAVSKTYPAEVVREAYDAGQRLFGENRPQEMDAKRQQLPADIEWHMIGHLQTNKVKSIAPYVSMIHSVDSAKLLGVINEQALKNNRVIDVLFEVHVAREESKHGWNEGELIAYLRGGEYRQMQGVRFRGLMGVATFTDDGSVVRDEFMRLNGLFNRLRHDFFGRDFDTLSMGMSGDYLQAIACGGNMVRIGSLIFGARNYV